MHMRSWALLLAAALVLFAASGHGENPNRDAKGEVEFQDQKWVSYADKAEVTKYKDKEALHLTTNGGGMVMLDGVSFEDGTIECDIAKGPFTGIVFHATDSQHGDCVYFRPQNAVPGVKAIDGTPGRDKVVQYVTWGDPKSEWQYLRKNFPGQYEKYADVPLDDWFHVRLEIKGRQVQVLVNDAKEPCLAVEKTLQENSKGMIGLWAWDGYFANFKFTSATAPPASNPQTDQSTVIPFDDPRWVATAAKTFEQTTYKGKSAQHIVWNGKGPDGGYVYLKGIEFEDGMIEMDIAGGNFLGFGFRGQVDGRYELVYFRPTWKKNGWKPIQYGNIGNPVGMPRYLSEKFPEMSQGHADLSPEAWFHVKLVIAGAKAAVYVGGQREPSFVVNQLLQGERRGTIGVWAWDGYFANFKATAAQSSGRPVGGGPNSKPAGASGAATVKDYGNFDLQDWTMGRGSIGRQEWVDGRGGVTVRDSQQFPGRRELVQTGEASLAYLKDLTFTDGVIECDMMGGAYVGLSFRVKEVDVKPAFAPYGRRVAEDIYFRLNGNVRPATVQYFCIGKMTIPDADKPPYEQPIPAIKQGQWFHVRVEVAGKQAKVFLDDQKTPVLMVAPLLLGNTTGSVGVRSWGGTFANFKYTPAPSPTKK